MKNIMKGLVRKILVWGRDRMRATQFSEYKVPLAELIQRAEARFIRFNGAFPLCPMDHAKGTDYVMDFRHSDIVVGRGPVRDDQGWKCTNCFHLVQFGLPITEAEALEDIDLRGGPTLMRPSRRPDEDRLDVVTERLRRLGYVE